MGILTAGPCTTISCASAFNIKYENFGTFASHVLLLGLSGNHPPSCPAIQLTNSEAVSLSAQDTTSC